MEDFLQIETFINLIGGIEVTQEEKEKNLTEIKAAIQSNKEGNKLVKIDNETFAKSYPESLGLVKEYYDSIDNYQIAKIIGWNGENYINRHKRTAYCLNKNKRSKIETLMIFAPELIDKEVLEIKKLFGISSEEVSYIFKTYKGIINQKSKKVELKEEMNQETHYLKSLILQMGSYCKNKIQINTPSGVIMMPFTMLDYYSLTNNTPIETLDFIYNSGLFDSRNRDETIYKNFIRRMLQEYKNSEVFVPKESILKSNMAVGRAGHMVKMNEEICDQIFELLEQEKIPRSKDIIEKAFQRYALNQPILPMKLMTEETILTEEQVSKNQTIKRLK